jgi:hypothetical protein
MTFSTFTPIQWIAFLFVIIGLIKIIFILANKKKWLDFVSPLYKNPKATSWIMIILAAVVFYYLLQTLSIVQIMAVMAFSSLLFGFASMIYGKELMTLARKIYNKKFTGGMVLYIILWIILSLWTLYAIFY